MLFPSTPLFALSLLIFSVLCLGLWPAAYKAAGPRYRFEIFSFDFAVGALLFALIAAYTFGTMGSELSFSDTMLVAGRRTQVMAFCAGAVFALGNMLLLCTVSLLGLPRAILLSSSLAATFLALELAGLSPALFVFLVSFVLALLAARSAQVRKTQPLNRKSLESAAKGMITGTISGLALSGVLPVMRLAHSEEFGIGAYGGVLMACVGMMVITPCLNFYFMTLAIDGPPLGLAAYRQGKFSHRVLGGVAGMVWAAGVLALFVVVAAPKSLDISAAYLWPVPFAAAVVSVLFGLIQRDSTPSLKLTLGSVAVFAAAIVVLVRF